MMYPFDIVVRRPVGFEMLLDGRTDRDRDRQTDRKDRLTERPKTQRGKTNRETGKQTDKRDIGRHQLNHLKVESPNQCREHAHMSIFPLHLHRRGYNSGGKRDRGFEMFVQIIRANVMFA